MPVLEKQARRTRTTTHGIAKRTGSAGATTGTAATGMATPTRACSTATMVIRACATFGEVRKETLPARIDDKHA